MPKRNRKNNSKKYFYGGKGFRYYSTIFTKTFNLTTPELHILYTNDAQDMNIVYRFGIGGDYLWNPDFTITYLGRIQNTELIDDTYCNDMAMVHNNYLRMIMDDVRYRETLQGNPGCPAPHPVGFSNSFF